MARSGEKGMTLLEMLIVTTVIGILAMIAFPKFASLLRKSEEGATKGNLGALRSAVRIYYADMEGQYPGDLNSLAQGSKYIAAIPSAKVTAYHPTRSDVLAVPDTAGMDDANGWAYVNASGDAKYGEVFVNCTHTDTIGSVWTSY